MKNSKRYFVFSDNTDYVVTADVERKSVVFDHGFEAAAIRKGETPRDVIRRTFPGSYIHPSKGESE